MDKSQNADKSQNINEGQNMEETYKVFPDRELSILYTEEEGGDYKFIAKHSNEETLKFYREILKTGILNYRKGDLQIRIRPAFVTLNERVDNYDFSTKSKRI